MIGLFPILARWRVGLGIAGALAVFGLFVASWHYRHAYHAEIARRKAQEAQYVAAQDEATLIAKRALDAAEARYRSKADEADKSYRAELANARSAADRYIASHRVRAYAQGAASGTTSIAESGSAGVPASLPADAVLVSEGDVQACTDAVTYGVAAHDWAIDLIPPTAK